MSAGKGEGRKGKGKYPTSVSAGAALDIALGYIKRKWAPLPIEYRTKKCTLDGWPQLRITEATAAKYFNGKQQNIGVITGKASNELVDIDLDHDLARHMAPHFLPPTDAIFGRKTSPDSHWLYHVSDGAGLREPLEDAEGMIVEYRGDDVQTVFPGSTHKDTGEAINWSKSGEPAVVDRAKLLRAVRGLAAATLIAKHWHGHRDDLCSAVVGSMLMSGAPVEAVEQFITAICTATNDEEMYKLRLPQVKRFAKILANGDSEKKVRGWTKLKEYISPQTVAKVQEWLGLACEVEEPWGTPHDFLHERTAIAFTAEDVPACIGDYAVRWAAAAGFDPTGVMASCVVTTAAALHDSIRLSVQPGTSWYESARVWATEIAPPGFSKTPMIRAGVAPLQKLHRELVDEYAANELQRESEDGKDEDEREPLPALFTNDCTIEKLSEVLADNEGGILFLAEELDSWLGSHDAYRSGGGARDRGEWLTLFDGGPHQVDRVKRGSYFVANWGVSLLSATTPAALQKLIHKLPNDGLLQRILPFMIAHPSAPDTSVIVREAADRYETVVRSIHQFTVYNGSLPTESGDACEVILAADARATLEAEIARYRELAPACAVISEGLAGHVAKYGTVLARLVLTFHGVECAAQEKPGHPVTVPVQLATVKLAARFLRKVFMHARAFYGMLSGADAALDVARRVGVALVADGLSKVSRSELVQRYKIFRDADDDKRREAMQLLVDFAWCRVVPGKYQMGYPTNWDINPAIHERFRSDGEAWLRRRALVKEAILANTGGT